MTTALSAFNVNYIDYFRQLTRGFINSNLREQEKWEQLVYMAEGIQSLNLNVKILHCFFLNDKLPNQNPTEKFIF